LNAPQLKTYILVFKQKGVNLAALVQYLHDSVDIAGYWNYIPLVFCVKSHLSADSLQVKLDPFFPSKTYFIGEINYPNVDGMLPESAWEWFKLDHHEKVRPPTLPPPNNPLQLAYERLMEARRTENE
jgi:hypothetical protein